MYKINQTKSNSAVNEWLKDVRRVGQKGAALHIRKIYSNLKTQEFTEIPEDGKTLARAYTGKASDAVAIAASEKLIGVVDFIKVDEVEVPQVMICEDVSDRFAFIETTPVEEMSAHQLSLVLFKELGSEAEMRILAMQTGAKSKFDLLDELKELLVEKYPSIRQELLQQKLSNALAITKKYHGGSLALVDGRLAVYQYINSDEVVDSASFEFMAVIGGDKTQTLDIMVLQSAFRTYKELVAQGDLPATPNDLNIAITKAVQGVKPLDSKTKELLDNLTF